MKVRDILDLLRSEGWFVCQTRGYHRQLKNDHLSGTVAGPLNHDIHPKILGRIRRQAGLERAFDLIDKP
jgi:predicted RNA binding protein YcfA (HicA-like mRNA interferase family)